jgi:hypothetical protein
MVKPNKPERHRVARAFIMMTVAFHSVADHVIMTQRASLSVPVLGGQVLPMSVVLLLSTYVRGICDLEDLMSRTSTQVCQI